MQGISRLAEDLLASQERLCCMELVNFLEGSGKGICMFNYAICHEEERKVLSVAPDTPNLGTSIISYSSSTLLTGV
jgi:hypothetical protein